MTDKKKARFLKLLEEAYGNVTKAARGANISRQCLYETRKSDPDFAAQWEEVVEAGTDALEQEAYRRAFEGTERPVFQGGKEVGRIRDYSDTLIIFLLKGRKPEVYRERQHVKHEGDLRIHSFADLIKNASAQAGGGGE